MFKTKKGMALPIVIIAMAVLILLGLALYGLAISETQQSEWQIDTTQAQYLGQSGVIAGKKVLETQLANNNFMETETIVAHMNTLFPGEQTTDSGSFTVSFERIDEITIKISSIGISGGSSKLVTLTIPLTTPAALLANPTQWVAGINLLHSVTLEDDENSFLGSGIILEGNPIQAPQGGTIPSIFQASAILFTNYNNFSLEQISESINITFDSEAMYFHSGVKLNSKELVGLKNDVLLSLSGEILNNRPEIGRLSYDIPVGFENYQRYLSFIDELSVNGFSTLSETEYSNYGFVTDQHYGIVKFGGAVIYEKTGIEILPAGYYFFAGSSPISIKSAQQLIANHLLIPIESTDVVQPALDRMFKFVLETSNPLIWDNK